MTRNRSQRHPGVARRRNYYNFLKFFSFSNLFQISPIWTPTIPFGAEWHAHFHEMLHKAWNLQKFVVFEFCSIWPPNSYRQLPGPGVARRQNYYEFLWFFAFFLLFSNLADFDADYPIRCIMTRPFRWDNSRGLKTSKINSFLKFSIWPENL